MKKITIMLVALTLPFIAQAKAEHTLSQATINATTKQFTPAYCKHGLDGMAQELDRCFSKARDNDPIIDRCLLGGSVMIQLLIKEKRISEEDVRQFSASIAENPVAAFTDKTIPTEGKEAFLNYKSIFLLEMTAFLSPRFQSFKEGEVMRYLKPGVGPIYQSLIKSCKK